MGSSCQRSTVNYIAALRTIRGSVLGRRACRTEPRCIEPRLQLEGCPSYDSFQVNCQRTPNQAHRSCSGRELDDNQLYNNCHSPGFPPSLGMLAHSLCWNQLHRKILLCHQTSAMNYSICLGSFIVHELCTTQRVQRLPELK